MGKIRIYLLLLSLSLFFFMNAPSAYANILDDMVNKVKDFFTPDKKVKKEFTIDSEIELAPGGDVAKNGQIDAGDMVRFSYTISNLTDQKYFFANLKTNINRKQLNFIHNIYGATSISNSSETITIPNFRIAAGQVATVRFDARINYYTDRDITIATEPEFLNKDKKSIAKSVRKEINAKRINKEKIPGRVKQEKNNQ